MASGGYYPSGMSVPDLSVFRSTYHFMTDPEVPERSDYPPGYSGHQPKTKFLFGYGSPTAGRSTTVLRGHQVLEAAPPLPTGSWMCKPPLERAQIPRPVTAPDGPSGQPEARPQQQQRQERRYFHPSTPFGEELFNPHYYCPPAYKISRSSEAEGSRTTGTRLRRSRSAIGEGQHRSELSSPEGVFFGGGGTGYDIGSGVKSSWWPEASAAARPSTVYSGMYPTPGYHRPMPFMRYDDTAALFANLSSQSRLDIERRQ
ncbi:hypothetical protein FOZ63_030363 [Perkinsus olseni]|uniref:Uncharacterized protein n=1 Tax=Perkinsus olseni TaxID=32597 RepID=A0A7J6RHN2_PEROL|nr:hypothetical protein FOZ62_013022 [Perkinsus olseni]KAF4720125.1 hypothetical protein FOZ63_030363 [Perkinsus olseni]